MKFSICNLGCKVNNFEANWYSQQLSKKYEEVDFKQVSDIYVINSCTVTNTAGSKTRQMMHKARKANPNAVIAVVGCYVQMESDNTEIFEDCDILIGSKDKTKLPEFIDQFLIDHKKVNAVEKFERCEFEEMFISNFNQTRAYLKIQDGCNQFCSYCTIPLARGRERCLDHENVIKQAKALVNSGHKELVLTGIHTGRWNDGKYNLTGLIKLLLDEVEGLKRLRISSIEMNEVTDELVELMSKDERIARHLHIPLQVGEDRLLKLNNRPYTTQMYLNRINSIKNMIPDVSISADVIVGLPTETDEDFNKTYDFIKECGLSFLHVFPYARKKHTVDFDIKPQVEEPKKKARVSSLTGLSDEMYNEFIKRFIGKKLQVLFERFDGQIAKGHCGEYIEVQVNSDESLNGQIVDVIIEEAKDDYLIASLAK